MNHNKSNREGDGEKKTIGPGMALQPTLQMPLG
jgi:hypothetical protein